ncbi:hypothetical protein NIASO_13925 [Niabella soli DSM 19437]|uniref:Uncharacterized protein n=1 Tax=Niabella soli DSM 19437 TaxID=929713 RepID=W0F3Y8_9BACT|nr:hypothetical protein NIASO_13925 [Niabella soli DSM 19437]
MICGRNLSTNRLFQWNKTDQNGSDNEPVSKLSYRTYGFSFIVIKAGGVLVS